MRAVKAFDLPAHFVDTELHTRVRVTLIPSQETHMTKRVAKGGKNPVWVEAAHRSNMLFALDADISNAVHNPGRKAFILVEVLHDNTVLGKAIHNIDYDLSCPGLENCVSLDLVDDYNAQAGRLELIIMYDPSLVVAQKSRKRVADAPINKKSSIGIPSGKLKVMTVAAFNLKQIPGVETLNPVCTVTLRPRGVKKSTRAVDKGGKALNGTSKNTERN